MRSAILLARLHEVLDSAEQQGYLNLSFAFENSSRRARCEAESF